MNDATRRAVERAIAAMHDRLDEPVSLDDMARVATLSKFHFTRVFERATGVTPARFLSALRLQQAKVLLSSTSMTVADISVRVGYNSIGTFTSRFTNSVGMAPIAYRRTGGFATRIGPHHGPAADRPPGAVVEGLITAPGAGREGLVFAGLFPRRLPEGRPVRCAVLPGPGRFQFRGVPPGQWYLLAHSVAADTADLTRETFAGNRALSSGSYGPFRVDQDTGVATVEVTLRPVSILDPPVLLALLDVRTVALAPR